MGVVWQVLLLLVLHFFEGFPLLAFIGKKDFIPVNQDLSNKTFHIIKVTNPE